MFENMPRAFMKDYTLSKIAWWEWLFPLITAVILIYLNYLWIIQSELLPFEHSGRSLQDCFFFWQQIQAGELPPPYHYPPLCDVVGALGLCLTGGKLAVAPAIFSQLVFLFPCLIGCWYLGRRLSGLWGGLIALLVSAGNLWLSYYSHGFFLEIALAGLVMSAYAAYWGSAQLTKPLPTAVFGIVCGLGMLCKWSFAFYTLPLWIYAALQLGILRRCPQSHVYNFQTGGEALSLCLTEAPQDEEETLSQEEGSWSTFAGLLIALCLVMMICGWWYVYSFGELTAKAVRDLGIIYQPLECAKVAVNSVFSAYWLLPLFFLSGCIAGFGLRPLKDFTFIVCTTILFVVTLYTFSGVPLSPRYFLPASLLAGILAWSWLGRVPGLNWLSTAVVACLSFIQIAAFLNPGAAWAQRNVFNVSAHSLQPTTLAVLPAPEEKGSAMRQKAFITKVTQQIIKQLNKKSETRLSAVVIEEAPHLDGDMLILEAMLQGHLIDIEYYLPRVFEFEPSASLLLINGGTKADLDKKTLQRLHDFKPVWSVNDPHFGRLVLCRDEDRFDQRPARGTVVK